MTQQFKFLGPDATNKNAGVSADPVGGEELLYVKLIVIEGFDLLDCGALGLWTVGYEEVEVGEVVCVSVLQDIFDLLKQLSPLLEKQSCLRISDQIKNVVSLILNAKFLRWAPTNEIRLSEQKLTLSFLTQQISRSSASPAS